MPLKAAMSTKNLNSMLSGAGNTSSLHVELEAHGDAHLENNRSPSHHGSPPLHHQGTHMTYDYQSEVTRPRLGNPGHLPSAAERAHAKAEHSSHRQAPKPKTTLSLSQVEREAQEAGSTRRPRNTRGPPSNRPNTRSATRGGDTSNRDNAAQSALAETVKLLQKEVLSLRAQVGRLEDSLHQYNQGHALQVRELEKQVEKNTDDLQQMKVNVLHHTGSPGGGRGGGDGSAQKPGLLERLGWLDA